MTEQKYVRTYDNVGYNSCVESICSKGLNSLLECGWKVVFITPRPTYTEYIIERQSLIAEAEQFLSEVEK